MQFPNLVSFHAFVRLRSNVLLGTATENLFVHAGHHSLHMRLRQMGVTLDHGQCLVSEHFSDLPRRRAIHCQVGGGAVPQIVKSEILEAGLADRVLPGFS